MFSWVLFGIVRDFLIPLSSGFSDVSTALIVASGTVGFNTVYIRRIYFLDTDITISHEIFENTDSIIQQEMEKFVILRILRTIYKQKFD